MARRLNRLTAFFSELITDRGIEFKGWYFGHYHEDTDFDKFHCLYNRIVEI